MWTALISSVRKPKLKSSSRHVCLHFTDFTTQILDDPVVLMELTSTLYNNLPDTDTGMKSIMIDRIMARFPAIHKDPIARLELYENTIVLNAVHSRFSDMITGGALDGQSQNLSVFTPPSSPDKAKAR